MELTDKNWDMIKELFPNETGRRGRPAKDNRNVVDAILWVLRTSAPGRDLPDYYGSWNTVYTRFNRWTKRGILDNAFDHFKSNRDNEFNMIDSSAVKAHQHTAGAKGGNNFRL
jgi:transposase